MAANQQYREFSKDSPADIALSCWENEDFIDAINDDRLSPATLMKFKNLYRAHSIQLLVVPVITFPIAWYASRWLVGFVDRGIAQSRFNFIGMFLLYPVAMYMGYTRPLHRKYYTELFTDPSDDGEYIRDCVAYHKPGLWKKISAQLEDLGFQFRQNIKTNNHIEFPTNFVSSHTIY